MTTLAQIIRDKCIPKPVLRYMMINFLDLHSIKILLLNVKEFNVFDNYYKKFLERATKGFAHNCLFGHFDVAQWLYSKGNIDISANNDLAFRYCCSNGHIAIAKWLLEIATPNIHTYNEFAFRYACGNGHLVMAKWLYDISASDKSETSNGRMASKSINISIYDDCAFRWACKGGHLELAQWLYSLGGVNIYAVDNYVFKWACKNGSLDLIRWLYTIGNFTLNIGTILEFLKNPTAVNININNLINN